MPQPLSENIHKFEEGFHATADQATQALKTAQQKGAEGYAATTERIRQRWSSARADLEQMRQNAADYSRSAAKAADEFAHERPWTTVGIAAGIGLLIGWMLNRD
ncbi:MAG: hypothetical protein H6R10_642 [Rhodocyclaceae bacterium]|nr:hypothetical protein [Rhodocyclaceae bacterium]